MECPNCGVKMKSANEPYIYNGIELGKFDSEKCQKCGEVFFTEESSDAIDAKAKELGLWGIGQIGRLGYSGNSIIVRVPKKIAEFLKFKEGKNVFIRPEGRNRLVVEPQ